MRIAPLLLVLLSGPTFSSDFRTLDFGASCENVVAQEAALGARRIKWPVEGTGVIAFEGLAFDRRLVFTYFCPKGVLFTGDYYFPVEPLSDAVLSYEAAHKHLSTTYGVPVLDSTPWMRPEADRRLMEKDQRKYMTAWNTRRVNVTAIFLPSPEGESSGWRVAIHFGKPLDLNDQQMLHRE